MGSQPNLSDRSSTASQRKSYLTEYTGLLDDTGPYYLCYHPLFRLTDLFITSLCPHAKTLLLAHERRCKVTEEVRNIRRKGLCRRLTYVAWHHPSPVESPSPVEEIGQRSD